ncbi:S8 family serine peptidase [Aquisalimonas sp.]|uniref:S8 family peptidase n=1 Tax=Aquisalimonas sp. TaxID=1872621 RepID=UPI0025C33ACE|nr:S8 family serine peptidase [Aquisalimonas sp.]
MFRQLKGSFVAGVFLCSSLAVHASADRYIILFDEHALPDDLKSSVAAVGGEIVTRLDEVGIAIARAESTAFPAQMGADYRVKSVGLEPAFAVPEYTAVRQLETDIPAGDPPAGSFFFDEKLLWGIERVRAPEAWAAGVTGSADTTVAIIDTGVAWNHPDLEPNVVFAACFTSAGAVIGFDTSTGPCNPYPELDGHGTHVAGTVAAGFGFGVVGVGPDLGLASYNTFELINGNLVALVSSLWQAQLDAAARDFDVINMSLGSLHAFGQGPGTDDLATLVAADRRVANAVIDAGTALVAAAGNAGVDLNGVLINLPGGHPGVVNVGATGIRPEPRFQPNVSFDVRSFFSNFGAAVDVTAPGGDCGLPDACGPEDELPESYVEHLILSTDAELGPACAATASCTPIWSYLAGTSMASPHVAGVMGLIRDENPTLGPRAASSQLLRTADRIRGGRQEFGHGVVDARGAID